MHNYSHLTEHPLVLDARIAIYSRAAATERLTHHSVHAYSPKYVSSWRMKSGEEEPLTRDRHPHNRMGF